jgi:hypothetical protein
MIKIILQSIVKLKNHQINKRINYSDILATFIIYILTFPHFEPDYSIGLDTSYVWALNYLFNNDYQALIKIVYPLGPLAFLKIPTIEGYNFEYFLLFFTILKMWFTYMFILLAGLFNKDRKNLSYIVVAGMLFLINIDYLIIGITFIYSFLYLSNSNKSNLFISVSIAFIGLCIKSSIGVSSFSIIFIAAILDYINKRSYKSALIYLGLTFSTILIWGLLIFQNIELLFNYFLNVLKLSISYSSALSIFPVNNWILLSLVIISIFLPLIINRNIRTQTVFLLLIPSVFAMWKHAMTRQDFTHSMVMFSFLFLYWGLYIVLSEIEIKKILFLAVMSSSLFYWNMTTTWNFRPLKHEVNGIVEFEKTILNFKEFKKKYTELSIKNVLPNKLEKNILDIIGDSTIDSYPWELSYFAANKDLNWKMRHTLQGGSFARWLDSYGAESFNRENGPQYIILHYVKDNWGGDFGSIDGRYLLNDNPLTIHNIFNYYNIKQKTQKFLLLEKNSKNNFASCKIEEKHTTKWNTWIDVTQYKKEFLRLKLFSKQTFLGIFKGFLYKTEKYYVDYMLEDGNILTYRYIPDNSKDGIWINPLIRHPKTNLIEKQAIKVRFRCTNTLFNEEKINYQFERILVNTPNAEKDTLNTYFNSYFYKYKTSDEKVLINCINNFDSNENNENLNISSTFSYSGERSNKVISGGFSYTYSFDLDTLWKNIDTSSNVITLETDVKYLNKNSHALHIVTLSGTGNYFWNASPLNKTKDIGFWDNSLQTKKLYRNKHGKGILKIYVWNKGTEDIYIDEIRVVMKTIANNI